MRQSPVSRRAQTWSWRLCGAVAATLACLAITACGGGGDQPAASKNGVTNLKVIETAGVPAAFLDYGIQQGYFKDQNLDLEVQAATGGAATLPAIVKGDAQLVGSNVVSGLLAAKKGLPVQFVTGGAYATDNPRKDYSGLVVPTGSSIRNPKQLEGKTIAVNTVNGIGDLTIKASLAKQGVDVNKLRFLELEFPEMAAALSSGKIDAAWLIEPFLRGEIGKGARVLEYPYAATKPGIEVGSYVATRQFVSTNKDVVRRFRVALEKTAMSVNSNPSGFRRALSKLAETPAPAAKAMTLPTFKSTVDAGSLRLYARLMERYGLVDGDIDVGGTIAR